MRKTQTPTGYVALQVRVDALAADIQGVKKDVHDLRTSMASRYDVAQLSEKLDELFKQFSERQRTNWQPLLTGAGVLLSVIVAIGALAYWPIVAAISEVRYDQRSLPQLFVPRNELDVRWKLYDQALRDLSDRMDKVWVEGREQEQRRWTPQP